MVFKKGQVSHRRRKDIWDNKDNIIYLYNKGESQTSIANKYHCNKSTISDFLKRHNIPIRPGSIYLIGRKNSEEARRKISISNTGRKHSAETIEKIRLKNIGKKRTPEQIEKFRQASLGRPSWNKGTHGLMPAPWNKGLTKENNIIIKNSSDKNKSEVWKHEKEIVRLYKEELLNDEEIAKIYNCSTEPIKNILSKNNAVTSTSERRKILAKAGKLSVWNRGLTVETNEKVRESTNKMTKFKRENVKGKTYEEIYGEEKAKEIKRKSGAKHAILKLGKGNPAWLGGKSFEPYGIEFNTNLRNIIRQRDNQVCINCGIHREKLNRALSVHHVNYDKTCNMAENLLSLCINCHALTNYNREYWTKLFQDKLSKLYDYKYDDKGNIILNIGEGLYEYK